MFPRWVILAVACFRWDQLIQMESQTHFLSCPVSCTPLHSTSLDVKYKIQKYRMRNSKCWINACFLCCRPCAVCCTLHNVQGALLYNILKIQNTKHSVNVENFFWPIKSSILSGLCSIPHIAAERICKPRGFMLIAQVHCHNCHHCYLTNCNKMMCLGIKEGNVFSLVK